MEKMNPVQAWNEHGELVAELTIEDIAKLKAMIAWWDARPPVDPGPTNVASETPGWQSCGEY